MELIATLVVADDSGDLLDVAGATAPGEEHHQVDRLDDQRLWRGQGDLQDQLLQAQQGALGGSGMDRGDTARVAGAPGLDQVQGLATTYFADHHPVGTQAQSGAHQISHGHHAGPGAQGDVIEGGALQLDRVFQYQDAVTGTGYLCEQRVGEGGLAGTGTAGYEDVLPLTHGASQVLGLGGGEDAVGHILPQRDDSDGALAQGEGRPGCNRWQHTLEALAGLRQFGAEQIGRAHV